MEVVYSLILIILSSINCLAYVSISEERLLGEDTMYSNDPIFTAKSPANNLISEESKIVDSPATENEVQQKQLDANQANYNFISQEKNDMLGTKKTKQQKQQYSNQPIVTVNSPGYNSINEEDDKVKKKSLKSMVKKLLSDNRKGSYNKIKNFNDSQSDASVAKSTEDNEWSFIHKPYKPDKIEDIDTKSLSSSSKLGKVASKIWSSSSSLRSPLSRSSSASSSSTNDRGQEIDSLLDKYDRKSDHVETDAAKQKNKAIEQAEAINLPRKPALLIEDFSLCSEISTTIEPRNFFHDGGAPTCVLACLYYKVKNLVYQIKPEGRCAKYEMRGPSNGAPSNKYHSCICSYGYANKYQYRIVQEGNILYSVQSKNLGTKLPLGTAEQIYDYVKENFERYLIQFLKDKRGVDWQGMYEYVRDLRWIRYARDDRPVGQYLSESLKEEINDIKTYWTFTIPAKLLKFGINYTPSI